MPCRPEDEMGIDLNEVLSALWVLTDIFSAIRNVLVD